MRLPQTVALAAVFLLTLHAFAPARAATAIYYSAKDDSYGWCAGYGPKKAKSCAEDNCIGAKGTACELVLECAGGWGAVALPDDPAYGIGASCDLPNAGKARVAALAKCLVATRALCWTDDAWNARGDTVDEDDNTTFDRYWYANVLLQVLGYKTDMTVSDLAKGAKAALKEFQKAIGRDQTGRLDLELLDRLVDAAGGLQRLAAFVKRDVLDENADELADTAYGDASIAVPEAVYSVALAEGPADRQLLALATYLAQRGHPCTLPAESAAYDKQAGSWEVGCAGGKGYTLLISDDGDTTAVQTH